LLVAGVAILSTVVCRLADGFLEAQPIAALLLSAVVIDLLVSRAGGELPTVGSFGERLKRALPWVFPGLASVGLVVAVAVVLGHARLAGASFDPASIGLGLVRALGTVARRQLPFVVLPLALLGARVDPRLLVAFAALATAANAGQARDSVLSVLVQASAAALGAVALLRTRDFLAGLFAETAVLFAVGTLFASVVDVRLGVWSVSPLERATGPYTFALALGLGAVAAWLGGRPVQPGDRTLKGT
jgi:hypothetical protein